MTTFVVMVTTIMSITCLLSSTNVGASGEDEGISFHFPSFLETDLARVKFVHHSHADNICGILNLTNTQNPRKERFCMRLTIFAEPFPLLHKMTEAYLFGTSLVFSLTSRDKTSFSPPQGHGLITFLRNQRNVKGLGPQAMSANYFKTSSTLHMRVIQNLALEFDTNHERDLNDIAANLVGLNITMFIDCEHCLNAITSGSPLGDGMLNYHWFAYSNILKLLESKLREQNIRPWKPLMSVSLDLLIPIGNVMYNGVRILKSFQIEIATPTWTFHFEMECPVSPPNFNENLSHIAKIVQVASLHLHCAHNRDRLVLKRPIFQFNQPLTFQHNKIPAVLPFQAPLKSKLESLFARMSIELPHQPQKPLQPKESNLTYSTNVTTSTMPTSNSTSPTFGSRVPISNSALPISNATNSTKGIYESPLMHHRSSKVVGIVIGVLVAFFVLCGYSLWGSKLGRGLGKRMKHGKDSIKSSLDNLVCQRFSKRPLYIVNLTHEQAKEMLLMNDLESLLTSKRGAPSNSVLSETKMYTNTLFDSPSKSRENNLGQKISKKPFENSDVEYLPYEDSRFASSPVFTNTYHSHPKIFPNGSSSSTNIEYHLPHRKYDVKLNEDLSGMVAPPITPRKGIGKNRHLEEGKILQLGNTKEKQPVQNLQSSNKVVTHFNEPSVGSLTPKVDHGQCRDKAHSKASPKLKVGINLDDIHEETKQEDSRNFIESITASTSSNKDIEHSKKLARTSTPTRVTICDIDDEHILNLDGIYEEATQEATQKIIDTISRSMTPTRRECFLKNKLATSKSPSQPRIDKRKHIVDLDNIYQEATQEATKRLIESIEKSSNSKMKPSRPKSDSVILPSVEEQLRKVLFEKGYSKEAVDSISKIIESNAPTRTNKKLVNHINVLKTKVLEGGKYWGGFQPDGSCKEDVERQSTTCSTPKSITSKDGTFNSLSDQKSSLRIEVDIAQRYKYEELRKATDGFAHHLKIGRGPFGIFYKGVLSNSNTQIAMKVISHSTRQRPSNAEVSILSQLEHPNLVKVLGYCRYILGEYHVIYEWVPGGSLDKALFSKIPIQNFLPWKTRFEIIGGVAKALEYLHHNESKPIIHRNVKASNIMLQGEKLGDFGLAWLLEHTINMDPTFPSSTGTYGLKAPEFALTKKATTKSDVYAFGILCLEIASGRHLLTQNEALENQNLVDWILSLHHQERILEALDKSLLELKANSEVETQARLVFHLGLLCSNLDPSARPSMRQVTEILHGKAQLPHSKQAEFLASITPPIQLFEPNIISSKIYGDGESSQIVENEIVLSSPSIFASSLTHANLLSCPLNEKPKVVYAKNLSKSMSFLSIHEHSSISSQSDPTWTTSIDSLNNVEYIPYGEGESIGLDIFDDPSKSSLQCLDSSNVEPRVVVNSTTNLSHKIKTLNPLISFDHNITSIKPESNDVPSLSPQSSPSSTSLPCNQAPSCLPTQRLIFVQPKEPSFLGASHGASSQVVENLDSSINMDDTMTTCGIRTTPQSAPKKISSLVSIDLDLQNPSSSQLKRTAKDKDFFQNLKDTICNHETTVTPLDPHIPKEAINKNQERMDIATTTPKSLQEDLLKKINQCSNDNVKVKSMEPRTSFNASETSQEEPEKKESLALAKKANPTLEIEFNPSTSSLPMYDWPSSIQISNVYQEKNVENKESEGICVHESNNSQKHLHDWVQKPNHFRKSSHDCLTCIATPNFPIDISRIIPLGHVIPSFELQYVINPKPFYSKTGLFWDLERQREEQQMLQQDNSLSRKEFSFISSPPSPSLGDNL